VSVRSLRRLTLGSFYECGMGRRCWLHCQRRYRRAFGKLTDYVTGDDVPRFEAATELRLHGGGELLATDRAADTSRHLIAALQPLYPVKTSDFGRMRTSCTCHGC
jgi:hypothetical protein